jgi:hypothetical protein
MDMNDAGSVRDGPPIWGLDMGYRPVAYKMSQQEQFFWDDLRNGKGMRNAIRILIRKP